MESMYFKDVSVFSNFTTHPIPSGCDISTDLFLQKFFSYTAVIKTHFLISCKQYGIHKIKLINVFKMENVTYMRAQ